MNKHFEEKWAEIEKHFQWENVITCMKVLGWKWAFSETTDGIPTIDELKAQAKKLCFDAYTYKRMVGSGGLIASYDYGDMGLSFLVAETYTR